MLRNRLREYFVGRSRTRTRRGFRRAVEQSDQQALGRVVSKIEQVKRMASRGAYDQAWATFRDAVELMGGITAGKIPSFDTVDRLFSRASMEIRSNRPASVDRLDELSRHLRAINLH